MTFRERIERTGCKEVLQLVGPKRYKELARKFSQHSSKECLNQVQEEEGLSLEQAVPLSLRYAKDN